MQDFSKLKGEFRFDNFLVKILHETCWATFGRRGQHPRENFMPLMKLHPGSIGVDAKPVTKTLDVCVSQPVTEHYNGVKDLKAILAPRSTKPEKKTYFTGFSTNAEVKVQMLKGPLEGNKLKQMSCRLEMDGKMISPPIGTCQ
ncbi:uncharacterized protein LOC113327750 [Papaver somniferum]|uniref:uncharacterized protein LOC113327750 n=1 Tax=Papaver somniferum TaxID=3469 RepID=UPI000E701E56|nr:uncharacterized protein LOC113327750 [Papaver somniferum]